MNRAVRVEGPGAGAIAGGRRGRPGVLSWGLAALTALVLVAMAYGPLLRAVAAVLILEDPLEPAVAIVPLGGHLPFRAMEAASLYRAGWAPRVVLVRGAGREERAALHALGVNPPEEWELTREVLVRLGVPFSVISVPDEEAEGTLEELGIVVRALRLEGTPVILVTSKVHARRVRVTWGHVAGGCSRGIVRPARQDPFEPSRWWHERRFALAVAREYLGLLNYWVGFPLPARTPEVAPAR